MTRAFVLMTAMPPTIGHLHLIEFAAELAPQVTVIVSTQPGEPYPKERFEAVRDAVANSHYKFWVKVNWIDRELEQDPNAPGFWEMWDDIMHEQGFKPGDMCVSSEPYGATLAARLGGTFMPYDPKRQLYYTKATNIREKPGDYFKDIIPEFQRHLRSTVTFFGAESTGKTSLSHEISKVLNGHWLFEYARPYLETVGDKIDRKAMKDIWHGQHAIQQNATRWTDKPYIFQDTDLFSTIGYWEQPSPVWDDLGSVPSPLKYDAISLKSDLYIITKSNIPFERDPIRYGKDERENNDDYWIKVADKYDLNYVVLQSDDWFDRMTEARSHIEALWQHKADALWYDRKGL